MVFPNSVVSVKDLDLEHLLFDLKKAIENGELHLFYQPILNQKKEIVAVEALLRWEYFKGYFISPELIIHYAEKWGMIHQLGQWIIIEACQQLAEWHRAGHDFLRININISPEQLRDDRFASKLEEILNEVKLDANFIDLEVTETKNILTIDQIGDKLTQIKSLGVSLSIDDFGTGYSSLEYISLLPLDRIKIDKCFLDPLDEKNSAIVKTIINLAKMLKLEVVAEGVENALQHEILDDLDCHLFQGYYFYKPMNSTSFQRLLDDIPL